MRTRFSAAGFARDTKPVMVDDFMYLPRTPDISALYQVMKRARANRSLQTILTEYTPQELRRESPMQLMAVIDARYRMHCELNSGREPSWVDKLPVEVRRLLRYARPTHDDFEPLAIQNDLPYSGMGYAVMEGGLVDTTLRAFDLYRLANIKQLGYLQDPIVSGLPVAGVSIDFNHSRFGHSLDVAAVLNLMLRNNGFAGPDLYTGQVAGLSHDALTPAGGDTCKFIDPAAFDEDAHYPELLQRHDWSQLRQSYGIDEAALIATVQGHGVLGKLLDLADKIAYVSRDVRAYLRKYEPHGPVAYPGEYLQIRDLIDKRPLINGIWDAIRTEGSNVVVRSPKRLADFLKLRVLLFRFLYYHEGARYREFLMSSVLMRYLYETGAVTRDDLIRMTDADLEHLIDRATGRYMTLHALDVQNDPRVEVFNTKEQAYAREDELMRDGIVVSCVENLDGAIKPETHYLVETNRGIRPFKEANPRLAEEIEALARLENPIRLYYAASKDPGLSPTFLKALSAYRLRELRRRRK